MNNSLLTTAGVITGYTSLNDNTSYVTTRPHCSFQSAQDIGQMNSMLNQKVKLVIRTGEYPSTGILLEVPLEIVPLISKARVVDFDKYSTVSPCRWSATLLDISILTTDVAPSKADIAYLKTKMEEERNKLLSRTAELDKEISKE